MNSGWRSCWGSPDGGLTGSSNRRRLTLNYSKVPGLPTSVADLAVLVVPLSGEDDSEEPVLATKGVLRVASRFWGEPVDRKNRLTDGRLSVARMVGGAANFRRAHLGLIELANSLCRPGGSSLLPVPALRLVRQFSR